MSTFQLFLLLLPLCLLNHFSHVRLFAFLCTIASRLLCPWDSPSKNTGQGCCALLQGIFPSQGSNTRLSRQEYWSGLPRPPTGDLPDPRIKPASLMSPVLAGRFFTTSATWEGRFIMATLFKNKLPQSFPGGSVVKNLAAV